MRERNTRRWRTSAALIALFAIASVTLPIFATPASAHATLIRANPANGDTLSRPPIRVTLNFSEPIEPRLTKIEVFDQQQNEVQEGETSFDDADPGFASVGLPVLDPGLYFVKWSNISAVDGHPAEGQYPFIVLNPDGTFPPGTSADDLTGATTTTAALLPKPLDVVLKWAVLLSLAIVAGAAFFLAVGLRPAARFLTPEREAEAVQAGEQTLINVSHVLLPLAFVSAAVLVLLTVQRFTTPTGLFDYLLDVRTGQYRLVQLVSIVVALAAVDLVFLGKSRAKRAIGLFVIISSSLVALLMFSLVSHGATGTGRFWNVTSDYVHLVGSATWLGALVMLVLSLRWAWRGDDDERVLLSASVLERFSTVATLGVVAIFATGIFNGLAQIPNPEAMVDTTYGLVLLTKLALIVPLMAIAGANAFFIKPRLVAAIDADATSGERASAIARLQRLLPRTVAAEIGVALAVFAAVAVLTQTSTAKGEIAQEAATENASGRFEQTATQDGLQLTLVVAPNRVGINDYTLAITDESGTPIETVTQARLRFSVDDPALAVPPSELILNKFNPGDYRGNGAYFTQPTNWRVEANVRRSDGDDVSALYILPVLPGQATTVDEGDAYALPFTAFTWNEVVGVGLAILGVLTILFRKGLGQATGRSGQALVAAAAGVLLISAAVLVFGVDNHSTPVNPTAGNPVKPTTESVERGRLLFQNNCVTCHGVDGRGQGPEAADLNPAPTDFRLHTPLHTDPQFFAFIADGYPGSAMPAYRDAFSDEDIWNLVNYLRADFSEAPTE